MDDLVKLLEDQRHFAHEQHDKDSQQHDRRHADEQSLLTGQHRKRHAVIQAVAQLHNAGQHIHAAHRQQRRRGPVLDELVNDDQNGRSCQR